MTDNKTWMPMVAGILDIIAGSLGIILAITLIFVGGRSCDLCRTYPHILVPIFTALSLPFAIVGILAIVGGVYALRRKIWGLALAGSIAAFFPSSGSGSSYRFYSIIEERVRIALRQPAICATAAYAVSALRSLFPWQSFYHRNPGPNDGPAARPAAIWYRWSPEICRRSHRHKYK